MPSIVQASGGWELDVYYFTSNRRLSFDLRNPVPDSTVAGAPSGIGVAPGRLITKCGSTTENFLQMTLLEERSTKGKLTTRKVGDYYMHAEIYVSKQ